MSLCLRCGLCCDGTVFHHALLEPHEAKALRGQVRVSSDDSKLLQGCSALGLSGAKPRAEGASPPGTDCRCAVYEERPVACRKFRCSVLRALEAGEVSEAEANEAIDNVLSRRLELAQAMGLDEPREAIPAVRAGAELTDEARTALERLGRAVVMLQLVKG